MTKTLTASWLLSAILGLTLALSGCGKTKPAPGKGEEVGHPAESGEETHAAEIPDEVRITAAAISEAGIATWKVQVVDLAHLLSLNGTVGYDENRLLQVAANVKGRIASIPVDLGSVVAKGQPLLVIESVDLGRAREEFVRELSAFSVSARAFERARKLVEEKAISAGEFQSREGDYLARKASLASAERTLHLFGDDDEALRRLRAAAASDAHTAEDGAALTLRAPFAGRVVERKVTPGALFEALQPLLTLADLSTVWVFLDVYEKDISQLHEGLAVTLRTEAYPQETFPGKIDFLGGAIDAQTRSTRVRATVMNRSGRLRPGLFVKALVDVPRPKSESHPVVAVPQGAIQTLEGRPTVFVQKEPGVFVRHAVETGHTFEGFTEVLSGVKSGDVVVTEGSFVLKSEFAKASLAEEH
ncbi:MAG TPA: efflux RND transporter periplasmic adaptor subunit [Thermoanaerobaculia bacterium]|nr:efflux RND transporter periplasmic adaptor subunit [Thermoanaerobaculia bacterium]